MALTLVTNPVGAGTSKFFAGFQKCELVFKREDIEIDDVESGSGGIKINLSTDLTGTVLVGDVIYLYSEGADYTYSLTGRVLAITSGDITIEGDFIQAGTGGYINYLKNYFVEAQCVDKTFPTANLLPFNLQSDGDAAGNIRIDVSIINDIIAEYGVKEFEVQYREVYSGSANSFTLIDDKLFVMFNTIDTPQQDVILNHFDLPTLYLGYPSSLKVANKAMATSSTKEMKFEELNINREVVASGTLGTKVADQNQFLVWAWPSNQAIGNSTKFINFDFANEVVSDFAAVDFATPDFLTT